MKFQPDRFSPRGDKREEGEGGEGGGEETNSSNERLMAPWPAKAGGSKIKLKNQLQAFSKAQL